MHTGKREKWVSVIAGDTTEVREILLRLMRERIENLEAEVPLFFDETIVNILESLIGDGKRS